MKTYKHGYMTGMLLTVSVRYLIVSLRGIKALNEYYLSGVLFPLSGWLLHLLSPTVTESM